MGKRVGSIACMISGARWRRMFRRMIGVVAVYAIALQSFSAVLVAGPATVAGELTPFELCLHQLGDGDSAPADQPGHHGGEHCVFCVAAPHLASVPPPTAFQPIERTIGQVFWPADRRSPSALARYSVAKPRGPPLGA